MREKVRVCVFVSVRERLVGALERGRLRGGGGGERERERGRLWIGVCSSWAQFYDRLTGRTDDGGNLLGSPQC